MSPRVALRVAAGAEWVLAIGATIAHGVSFAVFTLLLLGAYLWMRSRHHG